MKNIKISFLFLLHFVNLFAQKDSAYKINFGLNLDSYYNIDLGNSSDLIYGYIPKSYFVILSPSIASKHFRLSVGFPFEIFKEKRTNYTSKFPKGINFGLRCYFLNKNKVKLGLLLASSHYLKETKIINEIIDHTDNCTFRNNLIYLGPTIEYALLKKFSINLSVCCGQFWYRKEGFIVDNKTSQTIGTIHDLYSNYIVEKYNILNFSFGVNYKLN